MFDSDREFLGIPSALGFRLNNNILSYLVYLLKKKKYGNLRLLYTDVNCIEGETSKVYCIMEETSDVYCLVGNTT